MNCVDQWYIETLRINSNSSGRDYMKTPTKINQAPNKLAKIDNSQFYCGAKFILI
jgi:hypothetical protein